MVARLVRIAAWSALAVIVLVTLGPISARPVFVATSAQAERLAAFGVLGLLFGLAYPGRWRIVLILLTGAAISLEALQLLMPGRHGRLPDLVAKLGGGLGGMAIGQGLAALMARRG
jgi:VanZ family protein